MRFLYTILFFLILPFIFLRLWIKGRKSPGYRQRWSERLGWVQPCDKPVIWLHAVSLGELMAARPLIHELQAKFSDHIIFISNMTVTGSKLAQQLAQNNPQIRHAFVPYDLPFAIQRFLNRLKPEIAIVMETELWPNLLHYTAKYRIPILLANARLSEKSFHGYRKLKIFFKPLLQKIDCIAAQTQADAERFIQLGATANNVQVFGNIKYDVAIPEQLIEQGRQFRESLGRERAVLIAASTHAGEETKVLASFSKLLEKYPNALLILVPRHPERFEEVATLCQNRGFSFLRRSQKPQNFDSTQIFLGDSMGELFFYYAVADIAFVGGSFAAVGGHNLLEPAALQIPVLSGPQLHNFTEISNLLLAAKGLLVVNDENELLQTWKKLLSDRQLCVEIGKNAQNVVNKNKGAILRYLDYLGQQLSFTAEKFSYLSPAAKKLSQYSPPLKKGD